MSPTLGIPIGTAYLPPVGEGGHHVRDRDPRQARSRRRAEDAVLQERQQTVGFARFHARIRDHCLRFRRAGKARGYLRRRRRRLGARQEVRCRVYGCMSPTKLSRSCAL